MSPHTNATPVVGAVVTDCGASGYAVIAALRGNLWGLLGCVRSTCVSLATRESCGARRVLTATSRLVGGWVQLP